MTKQGEQLNTDELHLRSFWRQHFKYGRGAYHFHDHRVKREQRTRETEPLRFYVDLLLYPSKRLSPGPALVSTALLFSAQAANAAGFFWESSTTWWRAGSSTVPTSTCRLCTPSNAAAPPSTSNACSTVDRQPRSNRAHSSA